MVEERPQGHEDNSGSLREENLQLPAELNDESVANYLKMISRANPQQLPTAVRSVREVWAYTVGGWAERHRLEYVETVLLQLKISDDILTTCLSMDKKWHSHQEEKTRGRAKAAARVYALEAEAEAQDLKARIAKAKADQAEADKRRNDIEKPATPKPDVSAEARRKENFKKADGEVQRLTARRDEVLSEYLKNGIFEGLSPKLQEEYVADQNMYNDRIRQAKERRMQFE
jgi:hypothetical protein